MSELERRDLLAERERPVLLDEEGKELESIPEEEPVIIESEDRMGEESPLTSHPSLEDRAPRVEVVEAETEPSGVKLEGDFDVRKVDSSRVTIGDLRAMHRKKIEVSKQEKVEEQRRIEERERLVEAKKEELRMLRERESKDLDKLLGGRELLGKEKASDTEKIEEFDRELR
jgi:hypothetical protein